VPYRPHGRLPTAEQREIAARLGLPPGASDTAGILAARIADAVASAVAPGLGWTNPRAREAPSAEQWDLATELHVDISANSRRVAFARLAAAIERSREERLRALDLARGEVVCYLDGEEHWHSSVLSVQADGRVTLRGDSLGYRRRPELIRRAVDCPD
jgi:hypothetical protein